MTRYFPSRACSWFSLDDSTYLYRAGASVPTMLNATASEIWSDVLAGRDSGTIVTAMAERYGVHVTVVREDFEEIMQMLTNMSLVSTQERWV